MKLKDLRFVNLIANYGLALKNQQAEKIFKGTQKEMWEYKDIDKYLDCDVISISECWEVLEIQIRVEE